MRRVAIFVLFFFLFLLRLFFLPRLNLSDGQMVRVTDVLGEEPKISGNRQKINLGQFEIWADRYPEYHYGDRVEAVGRIKVQSSKACPELAEGFKVQSIARIPLLFSDKYLLSYPKITGTTDTTGKIAVAAAISLRTRIKAVFEKYYPSPLDGLIAGIVLGDKSLIPSDFWKKLQQTGTLHIMVASGMNIAMFSNGLLKFISYFFKRRIAILFVILVIWFYCLMTGMQAPIIRAGIMASLIFLSQLVGREAEGGRVLFITAGLMLFYSPFLFTDVGFQLSFLATAGLVYISPKIKSITGITSTTGITGRLMGNVFRSENFASSISSLLATLPILIINFGQINILSPLINFVVLWTIPTILKTGMLIGIVGILWIKLGEIASYLLFPILFFLEQTINLFARLTLFQVEVPRIGWWWAIGYYLLLWRWVNSAKCKVQSSKLNSKFKVL